MKESRRDLIHHARRGDPVCRQIHHANDVRLFGVRYVMHGIGGEQTIRGKQTGRVDIVASEQQKIGLPVVVETAQSGPVARTVGLRGTEVERALSKPGSNWSTIRG